MKQTQQLSCSTHLKKRKDIRDQKTKAQIKILNKNKLWDNTSPLFPHPHPDLNKPPPTHPISPYIPPFSRPLLVTLLRPDLFQKFLNIKEGKTNILHQLSKINQIVPPKASLFHQSPPVKYLFPLKKEWITQTKHETQNESIFKRILKYFLSVAHIFTRTENAWP